MPSRGSYQITSVEEGKAAQRDQSYRSCVLTLLIFFFLCVFLIIITLPWSTYHTHHSEEENNNVGAAQHHHHDHHTEYRAEKASSTTESIERYTNIVAPKNESTESETTLSDFEVATETSDVINVTNWANDSSKFERILSAETTTQDVPLSSGTDDEFITEKSIYDYSTINNNLSTVNDTLISSTEEYKESSIDHGTVYSTQASSSTDSGWNSKETFLNSQESTTDMLIEFTTENAENTTIETTTETFENTATHSTIISTAHDNIITDPVTITTDVPIDERVCITGECKNLASKMLFYMNHTVDPCEDFYEYACGGFEANPQTIEQNLEDAAYQRILRQMEKENREGKSSLFTKYYDSCMEHENTDLAERIELAKEALNKVGKFYTIDDWAKRRTSFTELLANLLLHNSALLFDVAPDLEDYSPKQFTLRIGPTTYNNPFDTDEADDPCYANQFEREQGTVDLGKLYNEYKICKNDTQKFIKSISEAMSALDAFKQLNNSFRTQHINITCINIDLEMVQSFFANFPSKDKIREAYLMKNYTRLTIEELERRFKVVNWTQLIYSLTKELVKPELMVQVYIYDALAKGLETLDNFNNRDPMLLHNALLGLYARDLYQDFVLANHRNAKKHCIRVAANVLIPEASNMYISSFPKDQLMYMNNTIHSLFEELKETLKLKIKNVEWTTEEERNALILKINNLKVAVPDISNFADGRSTYKKNPTNEVNLTDNYFENTANLMKRYRKLIYAELYTNPGDSEQIWTHYATPYQSKGLAIYGLNLVVIPFGVVDWSIKYDEPSFKYITMATLGNVIAHQIAHHFDANGIYYWNGTRDDKNSLLNDNDSTGMNFKEYINNQRNVLYQNPMSIILPFTGQNVFYEISQLTLNKRLSEIMGLRLAYDTLDRLRSPVEVYLPWFKHNFDQLFYLSYSQMYCTKLPLTSSYISLYENEQLPSRIRIFLSASNNRLFGEAWNCPEGSQIMPSYTCSPFPYLQCNEVTQVTMMRK